MKRCVLLFMLVLFYYSHACINIYTIDINGGHHVLTHYFQPYSFNQKQIAKNINDLNSRFNKGVYTFKDVSDYGAYLLMAGKSAEGLKIFQGLVTKYPGEYNIKANLAVAYELNGNIDSALYWEKQAIAQNPASHQHSEWIHLKILEARISFRTDPTRLDNRKISFISDSIAARKKDTVTVRDWILKNFDYQIHERLPFTLNKDEVFGTFLFELAKAYEGYSIYRAYYYYALSKYFYPVLTTEANHRMSAIRKVYTAIPPAKKTLVDNKEKYPPSEQEVNSFINKLEQRRQAYQSRLPIYNTDKLLKNLSGS